MTASQIGWVIILIVMISANLPWLSDRFLFFIKPGERGKRAWMRWLEWLLLYFVAGAITLGMEKKLNGEIYPQDWEFYYVTFFLFLVFALPGFIYRHDLLKHLQRR